MKLPSGLALASSISYSLALTREPYTKDSRYQRIFSGTETARSGCSHALLGVPVLTGFFWPHADTLIGVLRENICTTLPGDVQMLLTESTAVRARTLIKASPA